MYSLETGPVLRLVQITDTHLNGPEQGHLLGMKTLHSMQCVLELVSREQPTIDAMLVTGDLAQDGSVRAYEHLREALLPFDCPAFWFEGNHDEPVNMRAAAQGTDCLERVIRTPHWQLILLNSQVEGAVFGYLADDQLQLLERSLQERPDLHTLISFHHHPIPMGSRWIDTIGLHNPDALHQIVQRHPQVRCILWGHVHQASDQMIGAVRYLSTPSTCIQFMPGSEDFALDSQAPGYRWLELHADGRIDTGISRVEGIAFEVDFSVKGY